MGEQRPGNPFAPQARNAARMPPAQPKTSGLRTAALIALLLLLIAIPGGLYLRARWRAAGEEVHRAACYSNLSQIGKTILADYGPANNGKLPTTGKPNDGAASLALLYPQYLDTLRFFRCPGAEKAPMPAWPLTENGCSYQYINTADPNGPADTIIAYDKDGNHQGGRNALFMDGSVRWMSEDDFQRQLRAHMEKAPSPSP